MEGNFLQWNINLKLDGIQYPISREGHSLNYHQNKNILILFGGMNSTKNNELYFFSLKHNNWEKQQQKGSVPSDRCYHQSFVYQDYFIVFAGQGEHNKTLNDLSVLNLNTLIWKKVYIQKLPLDRSQFGLTFLSEQKVCYIYGGLNLPSNQFLDDLWKLDIQNLQFETNKIELTGALCDKLQQHGEIPIARKSFFFQNYKNSLFVYGGICMDPNINTDQIYQFQLQNNCWSRIQSINNNLNSRNNFAFCEIDKSKFVIYGGIDNIKKINYKNLLVLDLDDFIISEPFVAGQSPGSSNGHAMCVDTKNNKVYFLGGVDGQIKGMDIYSLSFYDLKNKNIQWTQQVRKNQLEQTIEERGQDYLFEINKKNNQIRDQILLEVQKKTTLQKALQEIQNRCDNYKEEQQTCIQDLKNSLNQKRQKKEESFSQIEKNLMQLKQMDIQFDMQEQKILLFQQYFKKIYQYTQMLDKAFNKISQSKIKRQRKKNQK